MLAALIQCSIATSSAASVAPRRDACSMSCLANARSWPSSSARAISSCAFSPLWTSLGTPQHITLQELRVEAFFPADAETEEVARRLAVNGRQTIVGRRVRISMIVFATSLSGSVLRSSNSTARFSRGRNRM